MNKRQTYTNAPAAIGPSQGEECVGEAKQQQQQGSCMPGFLFLRSFTNQEEAPLPQEGAWKDRSLTKKLPVGGSALTRPGLNGCERWVHPHTLQLTPTPPTGRRRQWGNLQISISKPRHNKGIKVHALFNAWVLSWSKLFSMSSQTASFPLLPKWSRGWPHHWPDEEAGRRRQKHKQWVWMGGSGETLTAVYSQHAQVNFSNKVTCVHPTLPSLHLFTI